MLTGVRPREEVVVVGGMGVDDKAKVKMVDTSAPEATTRTSPKPPTPTRAPRTRRKTRRNRKRNERPFDSSTRRHRRTDAPHWTARHGKPIIFVILTLVAVGVYLALTIPVAVFPDTNFPRIVVGVDNGVFPIDQMLVTVTKPLEEAVNTVPGLDHLWSITSRGTAEIDLFFNWNVDMYRTLELVNAALARVQRTLPSTAKITANRLTFAAFPIMGYSLTSDKIPQTTLWEMANYDIKPRLNRQTGVSIVIVQGGQVPEFEVQPDPAKLVQAGVTIPNILDAIGRSNMIDSPGLIEANHQLVLSLVSGQTQHPGGDRQHRHQDHARRRAHPHRRCRPRSALR